MTSQRSTLNIVTLNFNQGRFLRDAVESIRAQEYRDWRLIIRDPGSTDGSESIYRMPFVAHDSRITVIREPDAGPADALNKGFAMLNDEYCYYLNADDRVRSGAFAQAIRILDDSPNTDAVVGHGYTINEWGASRRPIYSDDFLPKSYVLGKAVAVQQATFFRRRLLTLAGGFNVDNGISWDGELLLNAVMRGAIVKTENYCWGEFRVYDGTITSQKTTQLKANEVLKDLARRHGLTTRKSRLELMGLEMKRRLRHPIRNAKLTLQRAFEMVRG